MPVLEDQFTHVFGTSRGAHREDEHPADALMPLPQVLTSELLLAAREHVAAIESGSLDAEVVNRIELDLTGDGAYLTVNYTAFDKESGEWVGLAESKIFLRKDGTQPEDFLDWPHAHMLEHPSSETVRGDT